MADDKFAEQIAFYELDRTDRAAFNGVRRVMERHVDTALERFYKKISAVPALGHFFSGKTQMDRAKSAQRAHWIGVFTDGINAQYHQRAVKIGHVHARIGLEPRWYIGAYTMVLEQMIHAMVAPGLLGWLPGRRALARQLTAMVKVSLLDIDIGLSGYFVDTEEKMRSMVRGQLGGALAALARGDLTVEVSGLPPEYAEVERDFNLAVRALRMTLGKVVDGVDSISRGSGEIRAASDDLSNRTEQQAASLERTAIAISDVTEKVQATAETTASVRSAMSVAHDEAEQGSAIVQRAVEAMGGIEASSREIGQIISVIDGIAFQTNLLALNAGVEAARAGDAGRGFAVVANEVRALAQRSADAANDIKTLITGSAQQVTTGVALVSETGAALHTIAERITGVRNAIEGIAESAKEQAISLRQINSAVADVDRMTQQNAAMSEQCTAAANSLATRAQELDGAVENFTFDPCETPKARTAHGQTLRAA